jgi:hypothetical protein
VATRRTVVITAAAAAVVLAAAGVSAWLYLRPRPTSDCAIVNDMIKYSKSENEHMRQLIPNSIDDPQKMIDAYQTREARMHQYAEQIHDPGLRAKADAVVNLDDKMLEAWRHTIPGSNDGSTSQDFQRAYADYARQSQAAGQALQAACPA